MSGRVHLLAVQINSPNAHPMGPGRSGAVGLAIVLIGLALVAYGAAPVVRYRLWRTQALSTRAFVVENVPKLVGDQRTFWLPIVEFQADGETVMSLISTAEAPEGWPLGSSLDVLYDPTNPHVASLAGATRPLSGYLIGGVGIIGMYLAFVA